MVNKTAVKVVEVNHKNKEGIILSIVTMKQLLEVGVHFGHQTKKWNPKMKKYIHTDKDGIYIIDLQKTLKHMSISEDL